jgi:ribulose-phosphate 3-epimerase
MDIKIAASILNADANNLEKEISSVSDSADWIHVDVMDNHFVPNLSFGINVLESLAQKKQKPLDAHLMIENPDHWAPEFVDAGADSVTFHYEAAKDSHKLIKEIHAMKSRVGLAIKPKTPLSDVKEFLSDIDVLLVMTVEPGFGGQSFMTEMLEKVKEARSIVNNEKLKMWVQVDGGVGTKTIEEASRAGADFLVVGSAAFSAQDPGKAMKELRELAIKGANN